MKYFFVNMQFFQSWVFLHIPTRIPGQINGNTFGMSDFAAARDPKTARVTDGNQMQAA